MNCPKNVVIAVRLLYFSLVVELAGILLSLPKELAYWKAHPANPSDPVFFTSASCIGMLFVMLGLMALLTYKISKGIDIARVIFASLFVLGLIQTLPILCYIPVADVLGTLTYSIKVVSQGSAAYLLFREPATSWFRFRSGINETTNTDSSLASVKRIVTAALAGFLAMFLFLAFSVFVALENCPGGDGYNPNGSVNKTFAELEKKLNELNKR